MQNKYTVGLYTLGCKVSQYETQAIAEAFEARGFRVLPFSAVCDAYVINTCTVTRESDRKSRQYIRRATAKNPRAAVAVIGCYSQRSPSEVAEIKGVSVVIGTENKMSVVDRVLEILECRAHEGVTISTSELEGAAFEPMCITKAPRTRAYVKIEDGCESKCTYCAIKDARGPVRSKPKDDVIKEVEGLSESGTLEIVLTGIETGSYGRDFEQTYTLADLIAELDERRSACRIRLGSLAPELIGESFVERVRGVKILAPHFHLSVQSGSDAVLRAMKRRYNRRVALENIKRLKSAFPTAQFTTDMMVGFPGESEEDFLDTLSFVREAKFLDVHVFAFSQREGTPAFHMEGQIDETEKRSRSARLIAVKNEVREEVLEELVKIGEPLSVILEAWNGEYYSAHSDGFVEVCVQAPRGMEGKLIEVVPVSHKNGILYAAFTD